MQRSERLLQDYQQKNKQALPTKRRWREPTNGLESACIPITANLVALIFVSLSDLTQDQRQVLTSWMAHRNRVLADYRLNELREVYLEIFCTTKNSVNNPLLTPSGHGGRKAFLVIEEGYLDNQGGYWVEDEEEEDASSRRGKADQTSPTAPPTPGKQMDSGMMIPGKTHLGMTGHGTIPRSPMQPRAKESKVRKAKEKNKYGKDGKDGK